jgi:hypothetical protein
MVSQPVADIHTSSARIDESAGGNTHISRPNALTGLAGAVVYAIGTLLPGTAPKPDASVPQIVTYFTDQRGSLLVGTALELIGAALLLWFVSHLRGVLAASETEESGLTTVMILAWVSTVVIAITGTVPALALIWRGSSDIDPHLVRFSYDIEILATYAVSSMVALVAVAAPSIVVWRTRVLPRWLGALGGVVVAVNITELIGLSSRDGALAGGYLDGAGALLWIAWFAAASVCLATKDRSHGVLA